MQYGKRRRPQRPAKTDGTHEKANQTQHGQERHATNNEKRHTWTRKISCYLCCFFGGCHWLPRRMKYQERPYNRTLLHSREAGREQTKTSQHIPFRFFIPRCRFRCILRFQKNAMHIGLTGFAESTVMRYLFCIEGASSPGDAYALSMATTLVLSLPCNPP